MNDARKWKKMMVALCLLALLGLACKDGGTNPPPIPERVKLTLIDVGVQEAYLHITATNPAGNETLALQRNGATAMTFAAVPDTNIADTALTQSTTNQYTASLTVNNSATGTSNAISAQTFAPTSHSFTWQTFLLGDGNGSALYDVVLINDSLAYAVGEMYLRDSSGQIDPQAWNAAKWNGQEWELKRIPFIGPCSAVLYPPIRAIWAFAADNILVTNGGSIVRYDGMNATMDCGMNSLLTGAINKIWGSNPQDVYVVGNAGSIVHYANGTWQRIESGTTTNILDVWGVTNPLTGKEEVYCAASSFFIPGAEKKILRITEQTHVDSIAWINRLLTGVWTNAGYPIYSSGDGVFENSSGEWREVPTGIYTNDIRGTALNDMLAVGDFGFIIHFNGIDWQVVASDFDAGYASVRLKGDLVFAVGRKNSRGLITFGRRN